MNLPSARSPLWTSALASKRVHALLAVSLLAGGISGSAFAEGNQTLCWGSNVYGQTSVPTTLGTVSALGGGIYHNIALKADGTVVCWGSGPEGQAAVPAGLGNAIAVAAGSYHSAAVKANRTVACWGRNVEGQCNVPAALTTANAVSAGWKHTVALKTDGTVSAWGLAGSSQINVPAGLAGVSQVSAGSQHNVALKTDGTVVCWGAGTTNTGISPNLGQSITPAGLSGVTAVAAGANHSVALKADGTVVCWGQNAFGVSTPPAGLANVRSIAAGNAHTLALRQNGTIVGWGSNASGQLTPPSTALVPVGIFAGGQHSGGMYVVAPSAAVVATGDSVCHGATGSIDVTVSEVTSTSWTGPNGFTSSNIDLTGVAAGAYTLVATGPGGSVTIQATVGTAPDVAAPMVNSYSMNMTASGGQDCTAVVPNFVSSVVAVDNCSASGALVVTQSPAAGSIAQLGDTVVHLTVRDESGNEVTVPAVLTVSGHPTTCFLDADGDAFGNGNIAAIFCVAPAGYVPNGTDCNDASASIYPGAVEQCDQIDQNCNGVADEGLPTNDYYLDLDADGFGDPEILHPNCALVAPAGHVANAADCNDGAANIHPGADERCADLAVDNDCDGSTAETEASDRTRFYADIDEDGAGDANTSLLACSIPDGFVTEPNDQCPANAALIAPLTYYRDFDQDEFGNPASPLAACELKAPLGFVANSSDCNDAALLFADSDGDGHGAGDPVACGVPSSDDECPDTQARLAAVAWYQDSDADGAGDPNVSVSACDAPVGFVSTTNDLCPSSGALVSPVTYFLDADADGFGVPGTISTVCETSAPAGFAAVSTDCNDAAATTYPSAPELCNEVDDDCDATVDEELTFTTYYRDADDDGYGNELLTEQTCTGSPNAGFVNNATDCDDGRAEVHARGFFHIDADRDGYGVAATEWLCEAVPPAGYSNDQSDCNDAAAGVNPGMTEVCDAGDIDEDCNGTADDLDAGVDAASRSDFFADADGDTFTVAAASRFCNIRAGFLAAASAAADCDDANNAIRPDALETCNGIDDNCVGGADDGLTFVDYFVDGDNDGFGAGAATNSCQPISGSVTVQGDCNDANNAIRPDALETCNGIDDNCVGGADDGLTFVDYFVDGDNDGFGAGAATNSCQPISGSVTVPGDCDDTSNAIRPDQVETCNGIDDNCVGGADDGLTFVDYFVDGDNDGFGAGAATSSCQPISGSVTVAGDCDDTSNAIRPDQVETCNGIDDNCVGGADDGLTFVDYFVDGDNDGFGAGAATNSCQPISGSVTVQGDCDDTSNAIRPDQVETCNGIDDNCVGGVDDGLTFVDYFVDGDNDGFGAGAATSSCQPISGSVTVPGDCDDANSAIKPGVAELCNGIDDNCVGGADDGLTFVDYFVDGDNDGFGAGAATSSCQPISGSVTVPGDCDDTSNAIRPDQVETCNGIDDNCAGGVDDGLTFVDYFVDGDNDGFGAGAATSSCQPISGSVTGQGDCDDANSAIKPGVAELCNGIDDNCVGGVDDGLTFVDYFVDGDNDGFGAGAATSSCQPISGSVTVAGDCDDANSAIKPGVAELCNGIDDNCVGGVDDGLTFTTYYRDSDGDSYGELATTESNCLGAASAGFVNNSADCNDADATAHPMGVELCANLAVDNDCDGSTAEAQATDRVPFFGDADGDGAGDATVSQLACSAPAGFVPSSNDQCPANGLLVSQATYYLDSDADGVGEASASILSCESAAPSGYAPVAGDGCPSDPAKVAPGACGCGNADTDADSDGTADCNDLCPNDPAKTAPGACGCGVADTDTDGDGVANCNDLCPNDPAKTAPGACGCGVADTDTDGDGVKDCESFQLTLTPLVSSAGEGDLITVRVASDWPLVGAPVRAIAMQLAVRYDHARLRLVGVDNQIEGAPFGLELARIEGVDNDPSSTDPLKGTLEYAAGIDLFGTPPDLGMVEGAPLVDLVFEVLPGTTDCGATDLVRVVRAIGSSPIQTRLTTEETSGSDGVRTPMAWPIAGVHLDFDGPVFSGVPGTVSVATDAGSIVGAQVALPPVVATDGCDGVVSTSLSVLLPDGSVVHAWPAEFPYAGSGVSVATWTAVDAAGNASSSSMQIVVAPFQLLDASLQLVGAFNGASTRSIRLTTDTWTQVLTVPFAGVTGSTQDVGVPVRAEYPCVSAKDTVHSLTATAAASVSGRKWAAAFSLSQGDSNDDDSVDIYDFSIFAAERGVAASRSARSNFNADLVVNNADFAFIGTNFFRTGETCGNLADGRLPVARVSVKDLRRQGLGHLAAADMNGDGWVDTRDIQLFMHGAGIAPGDASGAIGGGR